MQRITEKPLGRCPTCNGEVKRLISSTFFQLKGTGWYATDYARKEKPAKEGDKTPPAETKNGKSSPSEKTEKTGKSTSSEPAAD